jgi:DNA processing protein
MIEQAAYWIGLAHLPGWTYAQINGLIIKFFHEDHLSIEDFFHLTEADWRTRYSLNEKQVSDLVKAKSELASNAFLAESYFSQGFEMIPITDPDYPQTLKQNLKVALSPPVLYIKGNKDLLHESSIAVLGSQNASDISVAFATKVAKRASKGFKVLVSGLEKGVDEQALASMIKSKGRSIIVLPQGIMTFELGFKEYYKQIIGGDVVVLSTFHPKAPWSIGFVAARDPILFGLASELYVAEVADKGDTWSRLVDGLKKGRTIYVRKPGRAEMNANKVLIEKGATPLDRNGS